MWRNRKRDREREREIYSGRGHDRATKEEERIEKRERERESGRERERARESITFARKGLSLEMVSPSTALKTNQERVAYEALSRFYHINFKSSYS